MRGRIPNRRSFPASTPGLIQLTASIKPRFRTIYCLRQVYSQRRRSEILTKYYGCPLTRVCLIGISFYNLGLPFQTLPAIKATILHRSSQRAVRVYKWVRLCSIVGKSATIAGYSSPHLARSMMVYHQFVCVWSACYIRRSPPHISYMIHQPAIKQ